MCVCTFLLIAWHTQQQTEQTEQNVNLRVQDTTYNKSRHTCTTHIKTIYTPCPGPSAEIRAWREALSPRYEHGETPFRQLANLANHENQEPSSLLLCLGFLDSWGRDEDLASHSRLTSMPPRSLRTSTPHNVDLGHRESRRAEAPRTKIV